MLNQKIALVFMVFSMIGQAAFADCKDGYVSEIKRLDSMQNSARVALATSGVPAVAVPLVLIATGATLTPAGLIVAPLAVVGAAGFYGGIALRKTSLRKALKLVQNAEAGQGKFLQEVTAKIQAADRSVTEVQIAEEIIGMNKANLVCPSNDLGKQRFMGYSKVQRELRSRLNLQPEQLTDEEEMLQND